MRTFRCDERLDNSVMYVVGDAFAGVADAEFDDGVALSEQHGNRSVILSDSIA